MSVSSILRSTVSRLFAIVRIAAIVATVLMILAFLAGIVLAPSYIASTKQVEPPNITWTVESTLKAIAQLGLSPQGYNGLTMLFEVLMGLVYSAMAIALLLRVQGNWIGLYIAFTLSSFVVTGNSMTAVLVFHIPWLNNVIQLLGQFGWQFQFALFYFFPDGRFVPRWTRWLLLAWIAVNFGGVDTPYIAVVAFILVISALSSQIYRYARRADALQRQQTKWVLFAVAVMLCFLPFSMLPFAMPVPFSQNGAPSMVLTLLSKYSAQFTFALFPVCLGIAILRYRLWDVDVLIRRTLVYTILTGILAAIYFGGIILAQQILRIIAGPSPDLAIVISTLLTYVLFAPLRRRVQEVIDRRLFRRKYDAEMTLAQFNQTLRDEVDIEKFKVSLIDVVDETLQPVRTSLWIRDATTTTQQERPA